MFEAGLFKRKHCLFLDRTLLRHPFLDFSFASFSRNFEGELVEFHVRTGGLRFLGFYEKREKYNLIPGNKRDYYT